MDLLHHLQAIQFQVPNKSNYMTTSYLIHGPYLKFSLTIEPEEIYRPSSYFHNYWLLQNIVNITFSHLENVEGNTWSVKRAKKCIHDIWEVGLFLLFILYTLIFVVLWGIVCMEETGHNKSHLFGMTILTQWQMAVTSHLLLCFFDLAESEQHADHTISLQYQQKR